MPHTFYLMTDATLRTEAIKRLTANSFLAHTDEPLAGLLLVIEHPEADRPAVEHIISTLDPQATHLAGFPPSGSGRYLITPPTEKR